MLVKSEIVQRTDTKHTHKPAEDDGGLLGPAVGEHGMSLLNHVLVCSEEVEKVSVTTHFVHPARKLIGKRNKWIAVLQKLAVIQWQIKLEHQLSQGERHAPRSCRAALCQRLQAARGKLRAPLL